MADGKVVGTKGNEGMADEKRVEDKNADSMLNRLTSRDHMEDFRTEVVGGGNGNVESSLIREKKEIRIAEDLKKENIY